MFRYNINPDSEIPIYRQLVDQINARIRSGALKTGTQMPTVREMAEKLHLSCGTVKRVYDMLQELGDIEMTRRRGTFVKYVREDRDSRKIRAMAAIDQMVRQLTELNFSPAEIQIFLNLKMREWGLKWSGIRIAVVTEYMELANALEKQLGQMANVEVTVYSIRQLREYPYSVNEQSDVILCSVNDGQRIGSIFSDDGKLIRMALHPSEESIVMLSKMAGMNVGVLCENDAFAELVRRYLPEEMRGNVRVCRAENADFEVLDALISAKDWKNTCGEDLRMKIETLEKCGKMYAFDYRFDEGSMLYLEERIGRIRDERQITPAALRF